MNIFKPVDKKLHQFADQHNAEIFTKGTWMYGIPADMIEERRIIWKDGQVNKGIFIIPDFQSKIKGSPSWLFMIIAWAEDEKPGSDDIPFWQRDLLERVPFREIEKSIDYLLYNSISVLAGITVHDLRTDWYGDGDIDL